MTDATAGVHRGARERGGVAAGGAGAAGRADAAHRRAHEPAPRTIRNLQTRVGGVPAGAAGIGLDRRPQRADRLPLGRANADRYSQTTRRNWSRSHRTSSWPLAPRPWRPLQQATRTVPIVFAADYRSGRRRLRRQPGAAGRQRHRFHDVRIQHQREMAGAAQADRAKRDASGGPSGSLPRLRDQPSLPSSRPWRRRSGWR